MDIDQIDVESFLSELSGPPALLAIGEPMHGSEDVLRARNGVIADLVLRCGYRSVAVESDFHAAVAVDAYTAGGDGDAGRVLAEGLTHPFVHANNATRELLEWLRETNRSLDVPVRFYGFDGPMEMEAAPSPRTYLRRLRAGLAAFGGNVPGSAAEIDELAGDDARWAEPRAMYEAARSVGRTVGADRLRLLADDLVAVLDAAAPALAASPDGGFRLRAEARTAVGLLRHHAIVATDTADRYGRLSAQRDVMMADNLEAIAAREAGRGGTIVLAHNLHLQRPASEMRMGPHSLVWHSAGAIAAARRGAGYRFVAMAVGTAPAHGLSVPEPGTVEGELYRSQAANAQLYRGTDLAERLRGTVARPDRDDRGAYFPLAPEHLADTDGVLFLREVRA